MKKTEEGDLFIAPRAVRDVSCKRWQIGLECALYLVEQLFNVDKRDFAVGGGSMKNLVMINNIKA